jgi:hypothetical protein
MDLTITRPPHLAYCFLFFVCDQGNGSPPSPDTPHIMFFNQEKAETTALLTQG